MSAALEFDVHVRVGRTLGVPRTGQKGQHIDMQVSKVIQYNEKHFLYTFQNHLTTLGMNGPRRTACFAKGIHSYTLSTLK